MKTFFNVINFLAIPVGFAMMILYIYWVGYTNVLDGDNNTDWWYLHIATAIPCLGFGPASLIWWLNNRKNVKIDKDSKNPFA